MVLSLYILVPAAALGVLVGWALRSLRYTFGYLALVISIVLAALGIGITFDGSSRLEAGFESRNWPVVNGVVIESRVEGSRAFHPRIIYEYTVEGTLFRDSTALQQPSFGGRRRRKEVAETEKDRFEPGQEVAVHYDPKDPARSNLGRFLHWSDYGRTGTGGVLFGVGLCFMTLYLFGRRRSS
ncbi:MAG: DUF3592 domain-containing protein [bacterium]|nr:DUF3592 domain-containing protein [bacterium]